MATPYPPQHPAQPNQPVPQGGYAPNGAQHPAYAGYAQQGPYAQPPAQPHVQGPPQAPAQAYGQPQPAYGPGASVPPGAPGCRVCGAFPAAADVTIRQHTGLLVAMRTDKAQGPLCRTCATAIHRQMTTKTLAGGWFSPMSLFLLCWLTLAANVHAHFKIAKLPHPAPTPATLHPGKPILQRPLAYVGLSLIAGWVLFLVVRGLS
ncbi:hypothetical protein JCM4814A_77130 [Streptomyces phaeofaciens JCM 4814]|uniref:Uncharacterized protein n=1 Tax=Streptomyces phaeofaciens TaxID=68254 RepID=A0A918HN47_9ACTN|nr:hypothetical protein [Streptomyces phaeofaciens]GGT85974.1 hypothetical protein GCM10010226_75760 [Streptomyces phaeofaciens]